MKVLMTMSTNEFKHRDTYLSGILWIPLRYNSVPLATPLKGEPLKATSLIQYNK